MEIEKPIVLDLLDNGNTPSLSSTSDMPKIKALPDEKNQSKPAPEATKSEAKAEEKPAAPVEGKTVVEDVPADDLEQPESTSASDKDGPKKPPKGVQKRLDELTRQREDERRRAIAAEEREARLLALLEEGRKPKPESKSEEPKPPSAADFKDNPEAYQAALVKHAADQAVWKFKEEQRVAQEAEAKRKEQESIAEESKKVREAYAGRVEKFKESHPDYSEVAESPDVQISQPMALAITHSDQGPAIAYHLGSNPEEAERISKLPVAVQLMELGFIVAKLNAPATKPVSAAPAPLKPIKAASETPAIDPEKETMDQYAARRKKQMDQQARERLRH